MAFFRLSSMPVDSLQPSFGCRLLLAAFEGMASPLFEGLALPLKDMELCRLFRLLPLLLASGFDVIQGNAIWNYAACFGCLPVAGSHGLMLVQRIASGFAWIAGRLDCWPPSKVLHRR